MKDRLQSIFVAFVRKTFTKERLLDLIDALLDVVYDQYVLSHDEVYRIADPEVVRHAVLDILGSSEVCDSDGV